MNSTLQLLKILFFILMVSATNISCAENSKKDSLPSLIQQTLQSNTMFRGWDTKSYGEKKPHELITVIAANNLKGDIIILRWNEAQTQFISELYHLDSDAEILKSWSSAIDATNKSIVEQPGGVLHVIERVGGPRGGEKVEIINLND